jgi:HNH endonuclease
VVEPILTCPDPTLWLDRIIANVIEDERGCWIWQGDLNDDGYGIFRVAVGGRRTRTGAHRAAWLAFRGDIPHGLQTDHLCRMHPCANPWHLDLVTGSVNVRRADHSNKKGRSGRPRGQAGCERHGLFDGYLHQMPNGYIRWVCRLCASERMSRYKARLSIES